ncbi:hypothetical protein MFU01_63080 [Myxococcus fulvus]|uniref:Uncharacterized protein n=1 Tax=Myxococcus fulvus TaxID=33 RepID=A0A511TAS0_MYXFU|nr:hypothetical protein MFU01_63080 [Myxococcus fulvus]
MRRLESPRGGCARHAEAGILGADGFRVHPGWDVASTSWDACSKQLKVRVRTPASRVGRQPCGCDAVGLVRAVAGFALAEVPALSRFIPAAGRSDTGSLRHRA